MRKSRAIPLTLLSAAAMLSLSGCKSKQVTRCIDSQTGRVVTDDKCDHRETVLVGPPYPFYHWYYGGVGFFPGELAMQGSFNPAQDEVIVRASSPEGQDVIRGGFGHGFFGGGGA
ncbi:MAG TPA: hypothetical protein VND65_09050 [Candidatus Binatia bacterium]|nr:hypothetical protein [Candidatus Binatia bacterium]